jgi:hypothetical protein
LKNYKFLWGGLYNIIKVHKSWLKEWIKSCDRKNLRYRKLLKICIWNKNKIQDIYRDKKNLFNPIIYTTLTFFTKYCFFTPLNILRLIIIY